MKVLNINPSVAALKPPPIPLVQQSAARYDGKLGPLIDLSQAVPGYATHPSLLEALKSAAGRPELLGYGDIEGETELRVAYATHVSALYQASISSSQTHITSGCNQAFSVIATALAGKGDSMLLLTPLYFNHETTLDMFGIKIKTVATQADNRFLPDIDALRMAITSDVKAIVCVTPNNPTGAIYPPLLINELFDLCAKKGIWLVLDETYRDFGPSDAAPHSLLQKKEWQDHFIGLYSFSKSLCIPGHRLGAILAGEQIIQAVTKIMDNLQICAPRPPQVAVAERLNELDAWREQNRQEILNRQKALEAVIADLPGWAIISIGSYFSYVRHPLDFSSSVEAAAYLAQQRGVVTLPGAFFGSGQMPFLRFAFANATCAELNELRGRLG
ncbi:aminotransferase [Roseibium sp. HPY-6]|uniref:aminotransferase n=1 Tax=Roseibium sp. HPY-6 TaxID=3229852 RepID=UPI00339047D8